MVRTKGAWALVATVLVAGACTKPPPTSASDGGADASAAGDAAGRLEVLATIARAEDDRRADEVPARAPIDHDVAIRRRAIRALARIGEAGSEAALLRGLADEDEQTAGWAAYGLGWACKGHEEPRVRALAARAASLGEPASDGGVARSRDAIDARMAVARAVGRCGGALAEQVLAAWVRAPGAGDGTSPAASQRGDDWGERAALALGDIAGRHGHLEAETQAALADAATATPPLDAALYPFGRLERVDDALAPRVVAAAHAALARAGERRSFAIRALSRSGREAVADLVRVVESKDFSAAERAEAARGLRQLGEPGRLGAAEALGRLTPDKDPVAITGLGGDEFGVLRSLVGSLGDEAPRSAEPALGALSVLRPPGEVPAPLARRLAELRCAAAGELARGAYDADVLAHCDGDGTSEAAERARLGALARRQIVKDRRAAWIALTRSPHVRVSEAALELIGDHPELADAARAAILAALGSDRPGVVTTAAEIVHAHPDRVLALSEKEKRAALDPNAPPPTANPAREVDADLAQALGAALAHPWSEDLVETRAALLDAAVAVHLKGARDAALRACHDPNVTMREHAVKALRVESEALPVCDRATAQVDGGAPRADAGAAEGSPPLPHPTKVTFATDAGDLSITFEPELSPMAAARFVALARAGFYRGVVVHRVVPAFVVQLGDPGGDGYGGSGSLLRCETSPVPFARLDVGVALAGRDTGSSQLFVALSRVPHLDGDYARIGQAAGDWDAVAEGDVINDVKVEE